MYSMLLYPVVHGSSNNRQVYLNLGQGKPRQGVGVAIVILIAPLGCWYALAASFKCHLCLELEGFTGKSNLLTIDGAGNGQIEARMQVLLHWNNWLDLHSAALVCDVVCRAAAKEAVNSPPPAQLSAQKAVIDMAAQRTVLSFTFSLHNPNRIWHFENPERYTFGGKSQLLSQAELVLMTTTQWPFKDLSIPNSTWPTDRRPRARAPSHGDFIRSHATP